MHPEIHHMDYEISEHRFALSVVKRKELKSDYDEFLSAIEGISEEDIIKKFEANARKILETGKGKVPKSLSDCINTLIDERLRAKGWLAQSPIFGDRDYMDSSEEKRWTLDFAKPLTDKDTLDKKSELFFELNEAKNHKKSPNKRIKGTFSVEVAFNHSGSLAWNIIKPVLACELNHVEKRIETKVGIIVLATRDFKKSGGFDGAIGTYEEAILCLTAIQNIISSTPIIVVGLRAPKTFKIQHEYIKYPNGERKKGGVIIRI
jgi:hypothetical protein